MPLVVESFIFNYLFFTNKSHPVILCVSFLGREKWLRLTFRTGCYCNTKQRRDFLRLSWQEKD